MQVIIYTDPETGIAVVIHPSGEVPIEDVIAKDVPEGVDYEVVDQSVLPTDRYFRGAWRKEGTQLSENLDACKEISHSCRRMKREEEFKPHDDLIMKQIPGTDTVAVEAARAEIRSRYEQIQTDIDAAGDPEALRTLLKDNNIL